MFNKAFCRITVDFPRFEFSIAVVQGQFPFGRGIGCESSGA